MFRATMCPKYVEQLVKEKQRITQKWHLVGFLSILECVILLYDFLILVTPGIVTCSIVNCSNLCIACYMGVFVLQYREVRKFMTSSKTQHRHCYAVLRSATVDTPLFIATVRDSDEAAGNLVMFGAHHVTRKRYARLLFDLVSGIKHGFVLVRRWVATCAVTSYCVGMGWRGCWTAHLSNYHRHSNYCIIIKITWRGRDLRLLSLIA